MTVFAAMGVLITSVTVIACGLPTQAEVTVAGIHSLDWKQQFEAEGWI